MEVEVLKLRRERERENRNRHNSLKWPMPIIVRVHDLIRYHFKNGPVGNTEECLNVTRLIKKGKSEVI
jgi:hypothetical protein